MSETLAHRIARSSFAPVASELLRVSRPAVRLDHQPPEPDLPLGSSRFGGLPDVGPRFRWPRCTRTLSFLLQLDLGALGHLPAAGLLPADGLLSFFYDATGQPWGDTARERRAFRVVHTPSGAPLRRVGRLPKGMSPEMVLPATDLAPRHHDTLPMHAPPWLVHDEHGLDTYDPEHVYECHVQWPDEPAHQLLGYPRPIQGHLPGGLEDHVDGAWVSLLELDSDPRLGVSWGDSGKLHWLVSRDDLLAGRFDRVVGQLQCC